jgi:hypothetical protein
MTRQLRVVERENAQRIAAEMEPNVRHVIDMGELLPHAGWGFLLQGNRRGLCFERGRWFSSFSRCHRGADDSPQASVGAPQNVARA